MIKKCEICGEEFEGSKLKRICDKEHHRICKICGKDFIIKKVKSPSRMINREVCYNNDCVKEYKTLKTNNTNLERYGVKRPLQNKEIKNKYEETCLERYNSTSPFKNKDIQERSKVSIQKKYGVNYYMETNEFREKSKDTMIKKYGSPLVIQSDELKQKIIQTNLRKYGVKYPLQSEEIYNKTVKTCINKYGSKIGTYTLSKPEIQSKVRKTMIKKYGVPYYILTEKGRLKTNITKPNKTISKLLTDNGIENKLEFRLGNYSYDLVSGNTLLEVNPTPYHNSTWHPYKEPKDKYYHYNKSKVAKENGYRCIHIWDWDWDDINKIINMLKEKQTLYARKLHIREVSTKDTAEFLNNYHIQNTCKGQTVRLGLYMDGELIELMTFGKPRYNKNYEWELLRLCTKSNYKVVGGVEKLFNCFVSSYEPTSIISYCDISKFTGEVYEKLGFSLLKEHSPSKHWYNIKTKQHITNNLLKQRGFDQLFNTNYGKGTSNEELMKEHGFVEIYDVGQSSYIYKKS